MAIASAIFHKLREKKFCNALYNNFENSHPFDELALKLFLLRGSFNLRYGFKSLMDD